MKKQILFLPIVCILLLIGCSEEKTFENFFHETMAEMHKWKKNYSYSLIYQKMNVVHEYDAIAIFKENKLEEETFYIAYFEKKNGEWNWIQTRGARWDSPVNWSSTNQTPYIYSGIVKDQSISEVFVGQKLAEMIKLEGNKRFWYAISEVEEAEVKVIKKDGIEETMEEMLKSW